MFRFFESLDRYPRFASVFVKKVTYQKLSTEGLKSIGPAVELMAEAEGLAAHKLAVTVRLKYLDS